MVYLYIDGWSLYTVAFVICLLVNVILFCKENNQLKYTYVNVAIFHAHSADRYMA